MTAEKVNEFNFKIVNTEYEFTGQTDAYNYRYVCVSRLLITLEKLEPGLKLSEVGTLEGFRNILKRGLLQSPSVRTRKNNYSGAEVKIFDSVKFSKFLIEDSRATFLVEQHGHGYPWYYYHALYAMELNDNELRCKLICYGKTITTTDVFGSEGKRKISGRRYQPDKIEGDLLIYKESEDGGGWHTHAYDLNLLK